MTGALTLLLAFALGLTAGLRSMTPPAAVAWAAHFGWLALGDTPLAFLGSAAARWILSAAMLGELVADKLPFTPNRTTPGPFIARIASGGVAGAALAAGHAQPMILGAVAGALGGAAGTLAGYRARTGLVRRLGVHDYVIAVPEDVLAVGGAFLILAAAAG
jgi:uncharacterized membrane protein